MLPKAEEQRGEALRHLSADRQVLQQDTMARPWEVEGPLSTRGVLETAPTSLTDQQRISK
jgi:hypothetical protein